MTAPFPDPEITGTAYRQTLSYRLSRGPIPLGQLLSYASQIAGQLRQLHAEGIAHGVVSTASIHLGPEGATLLPTLAYPGEHLTQRDVQAWGAVLQEMLRGLPATGDPVSGLSSRAEMRRGPESVLPAARRLARECQAYPPQRLLTIQQALNEVRLLAVLARQYRLDGVPPKAARIPGSAAPPVLKSSARMNLISIGQPGKPAAAGAAPASVGPCPRCGEAPVYFSRPRTILERFLAACGIRAFRCRLCLHRWISAGKMRIVKPLPRSSYVQALRPRA